MNQQKSEKHYNHVLLKSIIVHSLDNFNYKNAEFACERLMAMDNKRSDFLYLYCLTLYKQNKYKSCYNKLLNLSLMTDLGCAFLFAKCCYHLKKYKEGIYQLLVLNYMYNESSLNKLNVDKQTNKKSVKTQFESINIENTPFHFTSSIMKHNYIKKRSIFPDSSTIYHLLGDLYKAINETKTSALNYSQAIKFNQFDFEAFEKLCNLNVDVRVKNLFKYNQFYNNILKDDFNSNNKPLKSTNNLHIHYNNNKKNANSFVDDNDLNGINVDDERAKNDNYSKTSKNTMLIDKKSSSCFTVDSEILDSFEDEKIINNRNFRTSVSTPKINSIYFQNNFLKKLNSNNDKASIQPDFSSTEKKNKKESTYFKIASKFSSQSNNNNQDQNINQSSKKLNCNSSNFNRNLNLKTKNVNYSNNVPSTSFEQSHHQNLTLESIHFKEIEKAEITLLMLYTKFAKSYKCFSKYDCYKSIRILESLPIEEKETPWALCKLGRLHYEIVNYKQSEFFFVKLRKLDRTRLEGMEYYSTLLWHLQKKVELTFLANELHDLDVNSPITWCVIGNLFSLTRDSDEAIKCFNKVTSLDENFVYAYTLKGHEYFGNDNYEMALNNFRISLLIDPKHYNALYGIGMVYINLGDYQKADFHFRKAISINPINIILICCVGMVLEKLGKKTLALKQYELANKLQPLNPLPTFKKAQLLFSTQQYSQALKHFEVLKDITPNEASVHFLLGNLYKMQNDKFQAIKEFTIALNLDPKGNYLIREAMETLKDKNN